MVCLETNNLARATKNNTDDMEHRSVRWNLVLVTIQHVSACNVNLFLSKGSVKHSVSSDARCCYINTVHLIKVQ